MSFPETVSVPCPGSIENAVRLTNSFTTPYGVHNLYNSGGCRLFLGALDAAGSPLDPSNDLPLDPGQSAASFFAPTGADAIVVVCDKDCSGGGELTYDAPDA